MAIQYAPLFALETQFQTKDGRNNTGGWLKVFLAATDDPATTYSDYNGTRNPEKIVLDDDGRAIVICDKSKAYRLEVYDINGMLLWTEEPVYCSGTGGGGVSITRVISTDGSIAIDESVVGSTTTYDIGIAPSDSDEFLEWIKCSEEDCGSTWHPVFQDGTMETEAGQGIKVHGGHLYHFTNSFIVNPDGTGINYDTFSVLMYCGDEIVETRRFDIDSSLHDPVLCEFSHDLIPANDSHVYFKLVIPATCEVSGEVQCHRVYSGINAVPDTCATKQWVSGNYQPLSGMSSYVPYSAMDHNIVGQVTGINGSAIVGSLDSATVSSIASSVASAYTESALSSISFWSADISSISSKADASSLTAYQPVSAMSAYATESYVDSAVSGKLDTSAYDSAQFQQASAMSSWIPYSALDYSGTAISGIGGSSLAGMGGGDADYTGIYPVNVDNMAREISVDSLPLVTDSSLTAYGSAGSSVIGVNMDILSGKLDSSAQVVTATATQLYAGTAYLTSVNGAPLSASRAGNAANASLANSAWYDGTGRFISALPDSAAVSAIASAYAESAASSKQDTLAFAYNTADQISSINGSALGGMDEAAVSGIASAYAQSAASSKLDASASSSFYSTANESGFITGVDLSPYQTTADMSSYIPTSLSSDFQQVTGMSSYALSADVSATVDLVGTQSANWGGSALALSAGPGVKLEKVGNTLVASTDEVVLWNNYTFADNKANSVAMSEDPFNFSYVRITFEIETTIETWPTVQTQIVDMVALNSCVNKYFTLNGTCVNENVIYARCSKCYFSGTTINDVDSVQWYNGSSGTMTNPLHIYRIVGINHTAGV